MMNEEVNWYLKQIDDLRSEYQHEISIGVSLEFHS